VLALPNAVNAPALAIILSRSVQPFPRALPICDAHEPLFFFGQFFNNKKAISALKILDF